MENRKKSNLIGLFDSGVGGLSILKEIRSLIPDTRAIYIADQAHVPYGKKSLEEIRGYSFLITRYLIQKGADLILVACNTASAAALKELREAFPELPFVGMEPAVKPAISQTHNGVVGVLATPATFQGKLYATLVEKFAKDVKILTSTLPGLVEEIESGNLDGSSTRRILEEAIQPMIAQRADTLVLGCTHFPFVLPLIREIAGRAVKVIDPSPAIARRTAFLLNEISGRHDIHHVDNPVFATTGDAKMLKNSIHQLLNTSAEPVQLHWRNHPLEIQEERN